MLDQHVRKNDYLCPRCKVMVMTYIPHECDPSICFFCNGYGIDWKGDTCEDCKGSGKTIWKPDIDEGVPV